MHTQTSEINTAAMYTAFDGEKRLASGPLTHVTEAVMESIAEDRRMAVLIFDDATGKRIEVDLRGTADEVRTRLTPAETPMTPGPGRPKLGVVAREVTLLPRHWDWLGQQPGGASVALRKLVEEARRANGDKDRMRQSQDASYQFLSVMAGDRPGFEEAARALFAGDAQRFDVMSAAWPADIRDQARRLATAALEGLKGD